MSEPERLAYEACVAWAREGHLVDVSVTDAADFMDQLIAMARDEERQVRCPGCGAPKCLKILNGGK